jgi:fucose permease
MTVRKSTLAFALTLNYSGMVSLAIAVNLIPVFLTTIGSSIDAGHSLTNEQLGRIGAVTFIGLVSGILITGPLADRFGAKLFAVLGNLLVAGGLALMAITPGYNFLLVAVAVMGFGAGVLDMVLSPIVCAFQPDNRSKAMNWLHSFYCVGAVITVLAGALALKCDIGWRTLAIYLIPLPALVALGFSLLHIPPLVTHEDGRMRLGELMKKSIFIIALFAIFMAGATELGMAQWLPAYAEKSLGFSKWVGGMALLAFSLAMAFGRMIAGMLGNKVKPMVLLLFCCWSSVIFFLLACFSPSPYFALFSCIMVGLAGSCLWPTLLGTTADIFPQGGASMFGLLGALGNLGGVFMPWIVGIMADHTSLNIGIATSTIAPFTMAILIIVMQSKLRKSNIKI